MNCVHCDEVALAPLFNPQDQDKQNPFCCYGCMTVFNIILDKGLGSYYEIKKHSAIYKRRAPVELKHAQFQYMDEKQFRDEYCSVNPAGESVLEFYLEGIHCLACLWLIEKLPEIIADVKSCKLNIERSVVRVVMTAEGKFSRVASELDQLGYRPHPLKGNQQATEFKIKEERTFLIRIGIAGAAAGNIMIYAVSLYGGATAEYASLFNLLTVLFAVPVLTYCAYPLYQNAWSALKNRSLSIDIPISVSLIMGGVMGLYHLMKGIPDNYFDSLTALVFLLLLSRYFLHKIQEKGLSAQDLHFFNHSDSVLKASDAEGRDFLPIHPQFIQRGDMLKIPAGEFVPADGVVLKGTSNLNNSLLTGESMPVRVGEGEQVFSGTQNLSQDLIIRAEKVRDESRLGQILKNVENGWSSQAQIINITNKVSKYFTLAVFMLAAVLFITVAQKSGYRLAMEQALTLLIVTCPCALALATPLTFTRTLSQAAEQGIIIKSDEVIERLAKIKNVFLDKTGTITYGKMQVIDFKQISSSLISPENIIFNLESRSKHPVARALMDFIKGQETQTIKLDDFQEILGVGVSGVMQGHLYQINRQGILEDQRLIATFNLSDTVRDDSKKVLSQLMAKNLQVKIISGDMPATVEKMAQQVGIPVGESVARLSPEEKASLLKNTPDSMMVGDGANDAIALTSASVGVAVLGSMDISLRAADVYLTTPGLEPVDKLFVLSQETMKVVYRNLILSLLYNSLSVTAAFMGIISPLVAAVIMPLSSLTVLISTIIGTKKMRALWK